MLNKNWVFFSHQVKAPSIKQFFMYDSDELDEQERSCYILPQ